MTQRACGMTVILALLLIASTAMSQQYYLYSPKAASAEAKINKADGEILVSEIVIKKGDTLSGISRKFSGKGSYYPQILLFNDIKNPNLIRTGNLLRVPVKKELAGAAESKSTVKLTSKVSSPKIQTEKAKPQSGSVSESKASVKADKPVAAAQSSVEQQLFEQAFGAYNTGDCRAAIAKFDQILTANPNSPFAADASLYKADCLLKLSSQ